MQCVDFLTNNTYFNWVGDRIDAVEHNPLTEGAPAVFTSLSQSGAPTATMIRRAKNNAFFGGVGLFALALFRPIISRRLGTLTTLGLLTFNILPAAMVWANWRKES